MLCILWPWCPPPCSQLKHNKTKAEGVCWASWLPEWVVFPPYIGLKQAWHWAVISAMHQIAHWRGREENRASSVTTRGSLCSRVSFGTCAQCLGKSRWHVGGSVQLHNLPVQTQSTYHSHFDVTASGRAREEAGEKLLLSRTLSHVKSSPHCNQNIIISQTLALWFWLCGEVTTTHLKSCSKNKKL